MRRKKSDPNQRSFFDEEHDADQKTKRGSPKKAKSRKDATPRLEPTVAKAQQAADDGIEVSSANCGDEWVDEAVEFIHTFLLANAYLHSDALWSAGLREPVSMRGIGEPIRKAKAAGWMRKIIDENGWHASLPSKRSNMALSAVWESLIHVSKNSEKEVTECCKNSH